MKISFPGLIFAQYKSINIYIIIIKYYFDVASIFLDERILMIAKELQKREVTFLNDVLVAVAVAVLVS